MREGFLARLARSLTCKPGRWLAAWLALSLLALVLAQDLPRLLYGSVGVLPDSQAAKTEARLARDFEGDFAQFLLLVVEAPAALPEAEASQAVGAKLLALRPLLAARPELHQVWILPEGAPRQGVLLLGVRSTRMKETEPFVAPLRGALRGALPPASGFRHWLTGQAPFSLDLVALASEAAGQSEAKVLPGTLVVLFLAFGALGAALLPLASGVVAVVCSLGALSLVARHLEVTVYASNLITMLGLGLGIDYALFLAARIREARALGLGPREAVAEAFLQAAPTVAVSAATVCLGLVGLALAPAVESSGMGCGGMIVAAWSGLVALTLMPALASLLGAGLEWPRAWPRRWGVAGPSEAWARWGRWVVGHPRLALALALALLLPLAWPLQRLSLGDPDPKLLPAHLESVAGVEVLRAMGEGGRLIPFRLMVSSEAGPLLRADALPALARLTAELGAQPEVREVHALVRPEHLSRLAWALAWRGELGLRRALPPEAKGLVSRDGRALSWTLILKGDQGIHEARAFARRMQARPWAQAYPELKASFAWGGPAVMSQEFVDSAHATYPRVLLAVSLVTLLMVGGMTRAPVLALKALVANFVTVAAALGATVGVVQSPWGAQLLGWPMPALSLPAGIPLIAFCVVFGLSMDYELFLLSRILEAHRAGQGDAEAVVTGLAASGGVITAAAFLMVLVFAGFALTPFFPIQVLGLALVLGVFLDATVVRLLLVPSLMVLMGRWNWWPGTSKA